jgi:hypothetical protein
LSWHGIPVQVRARDTNGRVSKKLDDRFMEAVDKAAMASKRTDGDSYSDGFVWGEDQERDGSAEDVVEAVARELEAQYPVIDYRAIARQLRAESGGQTEPDDLPE